MQVKREEFLAMLAAVKPGLAKREIFEQTTHFIFTGQFLTTYNDQIHICIPFETDFNCSVKAQDLYAIVNGLSGDLLDLTLKGETLHLQSTRTKARLSTIVDPQQKVEELSAKLRHDTENDMWQKLPDEFLEALNLCIFSASSNLTLGALTGVLIEGNHLFSSDHYRCSWYHMSEPLVSDSFIIQARDASELCKFPIVEFQLHENWVHFRTDSGVLFSTRRLLGEFKDIRWVFEDTDKQEVKARVKLPDDLKQTISLAKQMAESDQTNVNIRVRLDEDKMVCSASKARGEIERTIPITYRRNPIEFRINPDFFNQILDKTTTLTVSESRVHFKSGKFRHVIALVVSKEGE